MKKLIILVISTVMIGAGVAFKSNQDVSVPTVGKSSKETTSVEKKKSKVSKHEGVDKEKSKTDEIQVKEENTTNKNDLKKESVSSGTKKQDTQSNDTSKSSVKLDTKVIDSSNNNFSSTTNDSVQQTTSKEETIVEPAPAPETVQPSYACPGGVNQNLSCDVILDSNFYYATYGSMSEAESAGEYYLNDVMYIGNAEISNYSVQPVYRNDHSIAYYGLSLWSNGILIR